MIGSRSVGRFLLPLLLASAAPSAAQVSTPAARDLPAAESLYEAGKQLLLDGQCELAVGRLQASQSLDPAVGTLLLLGHCQEKLGQSASAWATFRAARSLAQNVRQPDREQIADARARALEPRLARIEIWLPSDVDTSDWSITENGRQLPRTLLGVALPVDPGPRELRVTAPGREPWTARIVIADAGATTRVRVPPLVRATAPEPALPPAPALAAPSRSAPLRDRAEPSGNGALRAASYLGVGLGAIGLGVGASYGILARGRYGDAVDECPGGVCSPRGERLRQSGDRHTTIATVSAISGAVLLAGGFGLWLAMPKDIGDDGSAGASVGVTPIGSDGLSLELVGAF
jgi:hypothetical protein